MFMMMLYIKLEKNKKNVYNIYNVKEIRISTTPENKICFQKYSIDQCEQFIHNCSDSHCTGLHACVILGGK